MFASHPPLPLSVVFSGVSIFLKGHSLPASASARLSGDHAQDLVLCCKPMSASLSTFLIRLCLLTPS